MSSPTPPEEEAPLDAGIDSPLSSPAFRRKNRRVSLSDDQGQSAKLALVEARVEMDDLRRSLVEANADRSAARLEQKCDREILARATQRHEEVVSKLRKEVEAVRELLEAEVLRAEDATHTHATLQTSSWHCRVCS